MLRLGHTTLPEAPSVRDLIEKYLNKTVSRRGFVRRMANWGFSVAAATSILDSLTPLVRAESSSGAARPDAPSAPIVEGTGADVLVEQLRAAGVRFVFNCNSSGTYAIFDALVDRPDLQVIQVPHEGQMVSIAQGYTLGSGKIAFTVNGSVGFPNTLSNMYNAWKDRTPIVIAAQREPTSLHGGRDAFEEWDDYLSPSTSFTRWRWSVGQAERIPEITRRAFKIASTPPQGPVALAFPTDVLAARGVKAAVLDQDKFLLKPMVKPSPVLVEEAARLLMQAKSPLLVVGPEVTRSEGQAAVVALAEQLAIPVAQGERLFADFPTNHPLFLGNYTSPMRHPRSSDLILALGTTMSYQDAMLPAGTRLIHVSIDPESIARVVPTDVGIVADVKEAAADLLTAVQSIASSPRLGQMRQTRARATKRYTERLRAAQAAAARARWNATPLSWERLVGELNQHLEKDAILVPELADHTWSNEPWTWEGQFTFAPDAKMKIGRTTGSALGWGVGAAIGVKLAQPDRQVVALQGDGGFLFAQAESLWAMARYEIPIIIVVFNNRSYNGPRNKVLMKAGRQALLERDMTCYLGDPDVDFAKVAAGFGVRGEVVAAPDQVAPALRRAIDSTREGRPYLIDAVIGRTGMGADSTWYPKYSVAAARTRTV
jgi:acetolactate synthase-1/2/3 large subunit